MISHLFVSILHHIRKQLIVLSLFDLCFLSKVSYILCGWGNCLLVFLNFPNFIFVIFKIYMFQIKFQFQLLLVKHYSNWAFVEIFISVCFTLNLLHGARREWKFVTNSCRSSLFKSLIRMEYCVSDNQIFHFRCLLYYVISSFARVFPRKGFMSHRLYVS